MSAGHEDEFRAWADRVAELAIRADGYGGGLKLEQSGGLFHLVHRFDTAADLDRWQNTSDYRRLMEEGDRFSTPRRQRVDGDYQAVQLPSDSDSSKWKRFLMTWIAVFPVLLVLNAVFSLLPLQLPQPARLAITSPLLTAILTWVILPRVSRWLKPWVMKNKRGEARINRG